MRNKQMIVSTNKAWGKKEENEGGKRTEKKSNKMYKNCRNAGAK